MYAQQNTWVKSWDSQNCLLQYTCTRLLSYKLNISHNRITTTTKEPRPNSTPFNNNQIHRWDRRAFGIEGNLSWQHVQHIQQIEITSLFCSYVQRRWGLEVVAVNLPNMFLQNSSQRTRCLSRTDTAQPFWSWTTKKALSQSSSRGHTLYSSALSPSSLMSDSGWKPSNAAGNGALASSFRYLLSSSATQAWKQTRCKQLGLNDL